MALRNPFANENHKRGGRQSRGMTAEGRLGSTSEIDQVSRGKRASQDRQVMASRMKVKHHFCSRTARRSTGKNRSRKKRYPAPWICANAKILERGVRESKGI